MTNFPQDTNSEQAPDDLDIVIAYRVRDLTENKFLGGSFENESKAERQLRAVMKSGKYPDDRFAVVGLTAAGDFIDPVSLYKPPEIDILGDE
ncbi:hypothetical protein Dxin01_00143 [Deinococcus xinjiangensis]|uniref:Uncharacterized protein n=1 Tax=Deinococcus xinjiangensis TaxID=457454 RepID=A0ABP9V9Q4_9DEIO